jgi:hypothetical protein
VSLAIFQGPSRPIQRPLRVRNVLMVDAFGQFSIDALRQWPLQRLR